MKKSVFIITKPLQYINATNIVDGNYKIGLVTNTFHNAATIFTELQIKSNFWDRLIFVETENEAKAWVLKKQAEIGILYTYSDYGFSNYLFLNRLRNAVKYVYEEGLGNYIPGLRKRNAINNLFVFFNGLLGNKEFVGGSRYIDGLFVYDPNRVKANFPLLRTQLFSFHKKFLDHLNTLPESSAFYDKNDAAIINKLEKNTKVLIYLGTWFHGKTEEQIFNEKKVAEKLKAFSGYTTIYKPHPHSGNPASNIKLLFTHILSGSTMAEMLVLSVLASATEMVVLHHASSAMTNFESNYNIVSVDLGLD